jgi:hypothetical protein
VSPDRRLAIGAALALAVLVTVFLGLRLGAERYAASEAAQAAEGEATR